MSKKLIKTWYRSSLQPEGTIWCESSDPEEVRRMSEGYDVFFQKLEHYMVTTGWERWDGV